MDGTADIELRTYHPAELAFLIGTFRQALGWSQDTLAELAGLTTRTVQRVEASEPSSFDTKRALARAFGLEDVDTFVRPKEFMTSDGAAKAKVDFERQYVVVEVAPLDGRSLVRSVLESGFYRAIHSGRVGKAPTPAEDGYAAILDCLRDTLDLSDVASHVEMLDFSDEIEGMIHGLRIQGWEIAYGSRRVRFATATLSVAISYVILVPTGGSARKIAIRKAPDE